jgi:hypothetical protein
MKGWKPILFVTLNSLLFLALLGSLMDYVSVHNGEDPLALLGIVVLFCPAFLLIGIALLILGKFFHISVLNKLLPFIAIPGLSLPTWGGAASDAGLLAGISIAAVLCALVIATTVKNLTSQREAKSQIF